MVVVKKYASKARQNLVLILLSLSVLAVLGNSQHMVLAQDQAVLKSRIDYPFSDLKQCKYEPGCMNNSGHRVQFTSRRDIPVSTKYADKTGLFLVECLTLEPIDSRPNKYVVCTTGTRENDMDICLSRYVNPQQGQEACTKEINRNWRLLTLEEYDYTLEIGDASITKNRSPLTNDGSTLTVKEGDVFEWQDYTKRGVPRTYHVYGFYDPSEVDDGTGGNAGERIETNDMALKIGTQTYTPGKVRAVAETTFHDPFGRIFDASSLEPVDNARVHIYEQIEAGGPFVQHLQQFVPHIYRTIADGVFAFAVKDGTYRLDVTDTQAKHDSPHPDTGLPASLVEKLTSKIKGYDPVSKEVRATLDGVTVPLYSDIYPASDTFGPIVENVSQTGKMEHRDIPVKAGSLPSSLALIWINTSTDQESGTTYISGKASHPYTIVRPFVTQIGGNGEMKRYLSSALPIVSDNEGNFAFTILDGDYDSQTEQLGGVDLVKSPIFTAPPSAAVNQGRTNVAAAAQTVTVPIDPVLVHLEGIAYDASGRPLVDGTVGVYINSEETPYAVATTDSEGYFFIPSYKLPTTTYTIKYLKAGQDVVTLTTSQFLAQNKGYLTDNKVNPYVAAKIPVVESKSQTYQSSNTVPEADIKPVDTDISPVPTTDPTAVNAQNQTTTTLVLAIVLILVSIASAALAVYYLKKHSTSAKI